MKKIVAVVLFFASTVLAQTTLFNYDYEGGREIPHDENTIAFRTAKRAEVLTEPNGNHFLRMYASPSDMGVNGGPPFFTFDGTVRSELLVGNIEWKTYGTVTVSFSMRLGSNPPVSNMLAQFYQYGENSGWVAAVSTYEGIVGVTTKDGDDFEGRNTLDMGAVKLDQWVQYVITVVFSPDAGGGRMNVLRDGQNMGSVSGRTLKNATDPMSFYLNLYGDPRSPYASVDFDNLLIRSGGQAPPVITVLPKPTGLTATCNMTTKKFSVQWDPVPGALNYYLRVDYSSNNIEPQWHISEGIDYNRDGFVPVTFTGDALSGAYAWWVHGSNTNGLGPLTSGSFICVGPPPPPPPPPNGDTKAPTPGGAGTVTATP